MQGCKDGRYRLRVGKYRVIYRYTKDGEVEILIVMEIGSRGDIYKYALAEFVSAKAEMERLIAA